VKAGDRDLQRRYWKQGDGGTRFQLFEHCHLSLEEWRPQSIDTLEG